VTFSELKYLVKKAFSQRRKKLRNTLKGEWLTESPEFVDFAELRVEQITVADFLKLTLLNRKNE